jgi:hypothetical protein
MFHIPPKWHDMYYPSRIVLPTNISKLIPLYIKQTWVHYPNLCATRNSLPDFLQGLTSMTTNPINQQYLVLMDTL